MTESNKIKHQQWKILALMFLAYGGTMLCRNTIGALSPAMSEDPDILLTTSELGEILAWGAVGSIVGKLFSGIVADLIGGPASLVCLSVYGGTVNNGIFATLISVLF